MKALVLENGKFRVIADSALARNRQPWFLPDFGGEWRWRTALALRVSRLGKGIRPEFASRYVDASTLLWFPETDVNPAADYMDGAAVTGEWVPLDAEEMTERLCGLVASASAYATLKTGDIIAVADSGSGSLLTRGTHMSLNHKGCQVLNFNIK